MSSVPTCLSIVQFAAATVVLLFGLGWLLLPIAFRREEFILLEKIPISFSLSVGSIAVIGVVGHFLGLNLKVVQYAIASLFVLLLLWQGVRWRTNRRNSAIRQAHHKPDKAGWGPGSVTLDQPADLSEKLSSLRQTLVTPFSRSLFRPDTVILVFAACCSRLAFWQGPWLSHTADSFYHLATVRRLIDTQGVLSTGAFFQYRHDPPGLDLATGTWHLALALLSSTSSVDITWIWFYLPAILTPFLILALYAFTSTLFANRWPSVVATVLFFLLDYEAGFDPWGALDFRLMNYSRRVGLALLWVALLLAIRYLGSGKRRFLALACALGLVLATFHFTIYELFLVSLGAYALFYTLFSCGRGFNTESKRAWLIVAVSLSLPAPFVLYKVLIRHSQLVSAGSFGLAGALEIDRCLYILDPVLLFPARVSVQSFSLLCSFLMIPSCRKRDRASIFLFSNMLIVPLLFFNPLVVSLLRGRITELALHRLIFMVPYPLVMGFLIYRWVSSLSGYIQSHGLPRPRIRVWKVCTQALFLGVSVYLLFWQVGKNLNDLYSPSSTYPYRMSVSRESQLVTWEEPYRFVYDNLPRGAVIAADPLSAYYLGGLTGRWVTTVAREHTPPGAPYGSHRSDSLDILDSSVDMRTTVSLMRKWNVTHVFVDLAVPEVAPRSPQSKFDHYPSSLKKIYDKGDVSIYEYDPAVPFSSWNVVTPTLYSEPKAKVSNDMVLASYSLDEEPIEPNQCVAFTLGWKPLHEIEENRRVEFRFAGVNSGHVFSETFDLVEEAAITQRAWKPDSVYRETYFVFIPDDVHLDVYDGSISLSKGEMAQGQGQVALGRIRLKEVYVGGFEGLTLVPKSETRKDFYRYYSGWMKYQGYIITRELGATMSKSIRPIPPGDYEVLLTVYDHEGQGSNQIEVTLNGVSRVVEWSGTEEGEREVSAVFEGQSGGSELSITSRKREQWYIVIDKVTILPAEKR